MSTRKKPRNVVYRLFRKIWRSFYTVITALVNSVLRSLMVHKRRRSQQSQAGFVLPTVVMVLLVVALLTTAIVIRSFDRAKNASNIRVDQAVLNAATPALDRARAKIERLFSPEENRLTSNPPAEGLNFDEPGTISAVLSTDQYTFNDETPLKVVYDIDGGGIGKNEQIKTAWKFPVDTNNNGKFDSFTLYGIYFRNPATNDDRPRSPLEARAIPQVTGQSDTCAVASSGGSSQELQGWYETDGQLKKAFFTYVANVPITELGTLDATKYEQYKGNRSFSALEMQQDQGRIALDNNAVWYDDDLVVSNVPIFRLNGRIHTNSNLMVANNGSPADDSIIFYQVSSVYSCYYKPENAKIIVGGHVVAGDITGDTDGNTTDSTNDLVQVHLYRPQDPTAAPEIPQVVNVNDENKTTTFDPAQIATNSSAYEARLNLLVNAALHVFDGAYPDTKDLTDLDVTANTVSAASFPQDLKDTFKSKYDEDNPSSAPNILKQVLTTYFGERIRRPSYREVPLTGDPSDVLKRTPGTGQALTIDTVFAAGGITPPIEWMRYNTANPTDLPTKQSNEGQGLELEATDPLTAGTGRNEIESRIGDRIKVGNSLPRRWLKADNTTYASPGEEQKLGVNNSGSSTERVRKGLVEQLDDLGDTSRGGYWERAAALSGQEFASPATSELAGGLRVITGAGVYIDGVAPASGGTGIRGIQSFLPEPPAKNGLELKQMAASDPYGIKLPPELQNETNVNTLKGYTVVWPDTMPMFEWKDNPISGTIGGYDFTNPPEIRRGDLQMRATVVYHSAIDDALDGEQEPIACIATFYDPTDPDRAQNFASLNRPNPDQKTTTLGASINGINYSATGLSAARSSALSNTKLLRQANMLFPDGRWVNKPLRDAVVKLSERGFTALNLADIAAIDAANCALEILNNPVSVGSASGLVPDFAIQEQAFLDARQIKALHKRDTDLAGRLKDVAGNPVTRQTTREYITNPDKLKIAELGELNLPITTPNYPFYSLPIEQRQPLEIRVTQIDLEKLRTKQVKTGTGTGINDDEEYLLPNSGIIYASRDDALPDISSFNPKTGGDKGSSATDFLLDPTRRPNGILLVNGANLARKNTYRTPEKGLILATDLPVYVKSQIRPGATEGGFNLHLQPGATSITNTTVREEFIERLDDVSYNNFYTRAANADGSGFDPNFACREGQTAACTQGDQWRAARILSDAVTLLSSNFRFGYRNEGDFDLNNNAGNLAVASRLKNGFWWNAFGTNGEWVDTTTTTGLPKDFDAKGGTQGSTYVTNGVTPIQRRANVPAYKMEICRKLPVSACGPGDWKLEIPGLPAYPGTGSGTTAPISNTPTDPSYVAPADRRYPRRVAFQRQPHTLLTANAAGTVVGQEQIFGTLTVPDNCSVTSPANCKATPLGSSGPPVPYNGTPPTTLTPVANTLWFWTTGDNTNTNPSPVTGTPSLPTDVLTLPPSVSYGNTNNLYYAPFDPEEVSERQLLLPGLPEFPQEIVAGFPSFNFLNSPPGSTNWTTAPSDYAVFNFDATNCISSQGYKLVGNVGTCPTGVDYTQTKLAIQTAWARLLTFDHAANTSAVYIDTKDTNPLNPPPLVNLPQGTGDYRSPSLDPARKVTLKAYAKVNIYTLPQPVLTRADLSGVEITFDRNNRIDDPIFVLRSFDQTSSLRLINYVRVKLNGVDPNNIFWVPAAQLQIIVHPDADPNNHQLVGNFLGSGLGTQSLLAFTATLAGGTPPTLSANNPILKGARFLGFAPSSVIPGDVMTAMTTASEPLLIPVLNLHSPEGTPDGSPFGSGQRIEQRWVQNVPGDLRENFNAVFIMGDSPSRPFTATTGIEPEDRGERGGGLANFPRFLEAWRNATGEAPTKIRGSFIQFKKSIFATAPFEAVDDPQSDNSLFFDSATPGNPPIYMADFNAANARPYIYKGGGQLQKAPYYTPPRRLWGYDVGLLKQTPDLFSRRFSTPSAGTPNEYFREVGRDDPWIARLLCAADATQPTTAGQPYTYTTWAISDPKQRPSDCQQGTPPTAQYNDP